MKQKKRQAPSTPLPVIIYPAPNFYRQILSILLQCYYAVVKPKAAMTGTFLTFGRFVWIHDPHFVKELYTFGSFGKGDLSRSEPTWFDRNLEQNKMSLEELTVERRRKRRNQVATENKNLLKPDQVLDLTLEQDIERFHLNFEEAFFLVYATNTLLVKDASGNELSIQNCWSLFNTYDPKFNARYAVYHYYRSLGWVPKNGLKFGVDLVLYQIGPSFKHAEYAVVIVPVYHNELEEQRNWEWLLRLNRISNQVKKTLVLCYVNIPKDTSSYTNLDEYAVREVLYKRWSPQKNRE